MRRITLLCLLLGLLGGARADTLYVTDQFKITLRSGESTGHKIVRMLPSGSEVEVLGHNAETGYTHVRANGEEGYVLTRQLMDEPSARTRVAALQQRVRELQAAPDELRVQLQSVQTEARELKQANTDLLDAKQRLEQDLAAIRHTAADAVRINNERNELRKTVAALTREREDLKQKNRDLGNQSAERWFLIGAGVIILGIVLGLILPHLRFQRRKNSWGSL